jgi:hypothetical protein
VSEEEKNTAAIWDVQRRSLAVHGRRLNEPPPSSERRRAQPPATTNESAEIVLTWRRSTVRPVDIPAQVDPESSVRITVPKSPTA